MPKGFSIAFVDNRATRLSVYHFAGRVNDDMRADEEEGQCIWLFDIGSGFAIPSQTP